DGSQYNSNLISKNDEYKHFLQVNLYCNQILIGTIDILLVAHLGKYGITEHRYIPLTEAIDWHLLKF
ncbi:44108_t:CDS:1, partial [Gigaspora margarita]